MQLNVSNQNEAHPKPDQARLEVYRSQKACRLPRWNKDKCPQAVVDITTPPPELKMETSLSWNLKNAEMPKQAIVKYGKRIDSVLVRAGKDKTALEHHKQAANAQDAPPMRKTLIYCTVLNRKVPNCPKRRLQRQKWY